MSDIYINLYSDEFNDRLALWYSESKKSAEEILENEAKLFIKEVIELTPPGKGKGSSTESKRRGELTVKTDMRRLFQPVPKKQADPGVTDLRLHHERAQNKKGRVPKGAKRVKVWATDFNRVLKENLADVGKLAGGWNKAAARLGYKPPAWIWRQQASDGDVSVRRTKTSFTIKISNRVRYATSVTNLENRLKRARGRRRKAIERQIANRLAQGWKPKV